MTVCILTGIIAVLCVIIILQCVIGHFERKDLYTRIMCGDVRDYTAVSGKVEKPPISRHREVINRWRGGDKS